MRVETTPGTVILTGAGPNPGFDMDIKKTGPSEVEVEFEADHHESSIEIEWEGGELVVDIEESPQEDGDD